ncbi:MAG: hypothetical protein ACM3O3_03585 [Syntrophothermus sp.]
MKNWYSPTFNKWFINDHFDLNNPNVISFAENITYILGWRCYEAYEKDMIQMLRNIN